MHLRRLVIAEAGRFPDLGRLFYERGPGRTIAALATAFQHLAACGALQADDPQTAAEHFNWLVMSAPLTGDALRRHRTARPRQPQPLRRCRDPGIPRHLRPELTSPAAARQIKTRHPELIP